VSQSQFGSWMSLGVILESGWVSYYVWRLGVCLRVNLEAGCASVSLEAG
jgi:hypothetical protein